MKKVPANTSSVRVGLLPARFRDELGKTADGDAWTSAETSDFRRRVSLERVASTGGGKSVGGSPMMLTPPRTMAARRRRARVKRTLTRRPRRALQNPLGSARALEAPRHSGPSGRPARRRAYSEARDAQEIRGGGRRGARPRRLARPAARACLEGGTPVLGKSARAQLISPSRPARRGRPARAASRARRALEAASWGRSAAAPSAAPLAVRAGMHAHARTC